MRTTANPRLSLARAGLAAGVLVFTLAACGTSKWGLPYRPDVQQGNWITAEQVAQLQQGMSREQVRFVLGTPTLTDVLHADRWDYPYFNKPGYGDVQQRKFTVWFENDRLVRWEGDPQPERQPFEPSDTGMTAAPGQDATPDNALRNESQSMPADQQAIESGRTTTEPDTTPGSPRPLINTTPPPDTAPGAPTPTGQNPVKVLM